MASPSSQPACAAVTAPVFGPRTAAGGGVRGRRILGGLVAVGTAGVLSLAAYLEPAGAGLGTHEQLSLPSCGWITLMDLPCPTCGMTTAFAHAANGDVLAGIAAQPLGFLLAIATAMAFLVGTYVASTGSRMAGQLARLWVRGSGWLLIGIALAAWGYKVISYKGLLA